MGNGVLILGCPMLKCAGFAIAFSHRCFPRGPHAAWARHMCSVSGKCLFLSLWTLCWLARTSRRPISRTVWLKVPPCKSKSKSKSVASQGERACLYLSRMLLGQVTIWSDTMDIALFGLEDSEPLSTHPRGHKESVHSFNSSL
eukprot:1158955-Pelagomonas_calceolata.AAC.21